jgi:hypothetical protein
MLQDSAGNPSANSLDGVETEHLFDCVALVVENSVDSFPRAMAKRPYYTKISTLSYRLAARNEEWHGEEINHLDSERHTCSYLLCRTSFIHFGISTSP